jgi:hypothetical protein
MASRQNKEKIGKLLKTTTIKAKAALLATWINMKDFYKRFYFLKRTIKKEYSG